MLSGNTSGFWLKKLLGFAPERSMPLLSKTTLRKWYEKYYQPPNTLRGTVYFFCDEFSNYLDADIGIKAIKLLSYLGYEVRMPRHAESGRAHISKGLLPEAKKMAQKNVSVFKDLINEDIPLIGLEPSAILSFRDEYPRLVDAKEINAARQLGKNALLFEEFIYREMQKDRIRSEQFSDQSAEILLHGHCHQKALSSADYSAWVLALPKNYSVSLIPSGCCGMAGSFGYEKEHFDLSMKIGELVLFPSIREAAENVLIAAPGTSCRHQVLDGTGRKALHPAEILYEAIRSD